GEDFAETCERRLVTRPRSFTCGDDQGLVGHGSVLVCGAGDLQRAAMVTHAVRCVLAILPEHKRLGTGGYSTDGEVLEFRFQFLAKPDDEIAHPLTPTAGEVLLVPVRAGQKNSGAGLRPATSGRL